MSMRNARARLAEWRDDALETFRWQRYRWYCPLVREAMQRVPPEQLEYSINISPVHRYVYMDNPKTGCSSLKSALIEIEARDISPGLDVYDWRVVHNRNASPLGRLIDYKTKSPLTDLVRDGFRFVTFVRNPYARVLSCYRDKILKNRSEKAQVLRLLGYSGLAPERPVSFEEFVKAIIRQTDYSMNPHWRVQTSHILYGILDYSFIGRFEKYQEDFTGLFRVLGIPEERIPTLRHINRTKEGSEEGCGSYYTPELQELIFRRYQPDFVNFGYGEDIPE